MAGANAAAPSEPSLLSYRSSCAHEREIRSGTDVMGRHDGNPGAWVEVHAGVRRWAGVRDGLGLSVPRLVTL